MLRRCLSYRPPVTIRKSLKKATTVRWIQTAGHIEDDAPHQIPPQLNYGHLVDNAATIEKNMQLRKYESDIVHKVKQLYSVRETILDKKQRLTQERDETNKLIRSAKNKDERQQFIDRGRQYKEQLRTLEEELSNVESDMSAHALLIPNDTHPDAPIGPEENAHVLKIVGKQRLEDGLVDHLTLAEKLDLVDFGQAAKVSGSKFYYLKNNGAWLEMALIQYAMQKATEHGFGAVITPDVVRASIAYGCGFQPRKTEASQIYDVTTASMVNTSAPKLCLTGTAEIPLAGMFAEKMLKEESLPQRVVGFGRAFRAEAGHGSAEERGLYRVHQFSKVELFAVTTPAQSDGLLEELRKLQEDIFTELGLCFRVLDMPTEELGASAYRKYDIEAWMPGRRSWGEISSTSNCTDYQTRRLDIRYLSSQFKEQVGPKDVRVPWHIKEKWVNFCHTLNGTAIAVPRVIIALLETFQRPDGTVEIPEVLRKWIPGQPKVLS
ncbi:seryl-tRNA synthetase [Zychaea mexicana]|uniref:seryl-tRNA synthetase n=1 Tax=Zychaea mexicana TaxID=64656 RepID=UPI0022FE408C|nr:seryl-tRNA synthetase [Zychaea mexicana]KAI9496487.1 seryl-tRNA synthetase [Zychaea mexicana]